MLAFTRVKNEHVIIEVPPSDKPIQIKVSVVDVRSNRVRLGFEAPRAVAIDREEIYNAKQDDKATAGRPD